MVGMRGAVQDVPKWHTGSPVPTYSAMLSWPVAHCRGQRIKSYANRPWCVRSTKDTVTMLGVLVILWGLYSTGHWTLFWGHIWRSLKETPISVLKGPGDIRYRTSMQAYIQPFELFLRPCILLFKKQKQPYINRAYSLIYRNISSIYKIYFIYRYIDIYLYLHVDIDIYLVERYMSLDIEIDYII